MRLLILQFVAPGQTDPLPVFSHELGVLGALLKADGIDCRLAALPGYRPESIRAALAKHSPDAVLADIDLYSAAAAHRTIADVAQATRPVVVCGRWPTCVPSKAVSIPGVKALLLGEYEHSGPALFRALRDKADPAGIPGTWVHSSGSLVRGPVPHLLEDLDSLPWPDRELFDTARLVQSTRDLGFQAGLGCPNWCAFCVNDWYMDLYSDKGSYTRRRGVANVLEEVYATVTQFPAAASVTFLNHTFAQDKAWIEEFAASYNGRCALPYHCFVPVPIVTPELATLLARSHCRSVRTNVISGSRFIRDEIFSLRTTDVQIVRACQALREAGVSVTADVFLGCPYESQITAEETIALLRKCECDHVNCRVFYPAPGTRAAELCEENGWTSGRGEENYWLNRSVLDMPAMPAARIDALASKLEAMTRRRGALGKIFQKMMGQ